MLDDHLWVWALAQAPLLQNWIAGFAMLVLFTMLYYTRTPHEERTMLDHFEEEYASYMRRTGEVLPGLRK